MLGKRRSKPPTDEERKVTDPERARERTINRAVRLLAARPRSIRELRERLLEKAWTNAEIVESVIEKLKDYKYLDDEQYARDVALSKLRQKPQGKRRLMQSMSQRKIDRPTVEGAVADAFEDMPETELIDLAIRKRLRLKGTPETREDKKKFYDYLLRLGFDYSLIKERLESLASLRLDDEEY